MAIYAEFIINTQQDMGAQMVCALYLKLPSKYRIGPHNQDIVSIIVGTLLGDGYLEQHGKGSRLCFQQEFPHKGYILW